MKKILLLIMVFIGCFMLIAGCAGDKKMAARQRLAAMSDRELIEHYNTTEMRLNDLDRAKAQSMEENERLSSGREDAKYLNQMNYLHIGDTWSELRKEKDLTLKEMRIRGIWPPRE